MNTGDLVVSLFLVNARRGWRWRGYDTVVSLAYINTDEAVIITSRQEPGTSDIERQVRTGNQKMKLLH